MQKKSIKKTLALVLAGATVLSFTGCGNTQKESTQEITTEAQKEVTELDKAAGIALNNLIASLKNPHSLKVYSMGAKSNAQCYIVRIEYEATNDFGAACESTRYFEVNKLLWDSAESMDRQKMLFEGWGVRSGESSKDYDAINSEETVLDYDFVNEHMTESVKEVDY